jgi:hydroxyacylglutathione hydrolase
MKALRFLVPFLFCFILALPVEGLPGEKGMAGDAEAAKHGFHAAMHQVVEQENLTDFIFRQYDLGVLSHYSYLIGSEGKAIVVDPSRDIEPYLKDAKELNLKIIGIYLTHSHADFVAGHMELARATGAPIYINKLSEAGYKHIPISDNQEINFGNVRCVVRNTPGHTPDGTCLFVYYPASSKDPRLALTGDTLFIGSVGRPDLMGGKYSAAELASMIFNSWNNILSQVPDATKIYPAHGAGSLCGTNLSDASVSTFGEQKKENPYIQHKDLATFVTAVIGDLPKAPQYFAHNAAMNRVGPSLVSWDKEMPKPLPPDEVAAKAKQGVWLLDVRDPKDFSAGHVPGSINIPVRGRFETWAGIMLPWGEPLVLIGSDTDVKEARFRLHRIGYDNPEGYLQGGITAWTDARIPLNTVKLVPPRDLYEQMQQGTPPVLVDVRLPKEWMALRIGENLLNLPIDKLAEDSAKLDPRMPVLTICNSAYRSSMGASVLLKAGFKDVRNLEGGSEAWINAGLPAYSAKGKAEKAPKAVVYVNLPERCSPADLAQQIMDLPGSVDIVDVRPEWQFLEYQIPGSFNVAIEEVMHNPSYLVGKRPLVIVCRNGSLSAAVAGTLISKTQRPIKFLVGGVGRYWDEMMRPQGIRSPSMNGPAGPGRSAPPSAAPTSPPSSPPAGESPKAMPEEKPASPQKKKSSAGC